ncbi:MAG: hypothetical protein HZB26_23125 [Candidatus Hydrogenedentes bacterium]|nr:hypothetical protein [Candidatus Hydrogenedentota bacterium]
MRRKLPIRARIVALAALVFGLWALLAPSSLRTVWEFTRQTLMGQQTVSSRVRQFDSVVRRRLEPEFARIQLAYPPKAVALVGVKKDRLLEVWVSGDDDTWGLLRAYPIFGLSGTLGPKLREGDLQVPEGIYAVESLNPNSAFHLSLRVGYPNEFDRAQAKSEGRTQLGNDIMIHGGSSSIGCIAVGDEAAEDLFVLAAEIGLENVRVILTPVDFRTGAHPTDSPANPAWLQELYDRIAAALRPLTGAPQKG